MKTKILLFLLLLSHTSNLSSQTFFESVYNKLADIFSYSENKFNIQPAPSLTIEDAIFYKILELKNMGVNFKFWNELSLGQYIIDYNEQELSLKFLKANSSSILNNTTRKTANNDVLGIVKFNIVKIDNFYSFKTENEIYFNQMEIENNDNSSVPLNHNFQDRILIDKEIGNLSLISPLYPNLGKIFNRSIVRDRTRGSNQQPTNLFADATAGTVIPIPLGAGSPKVLIVDKIWDRIIMMDRDIVNGLNTLSISYPLYPGNPYTFLYPTDITQGSRRAKVYGNFVDSIVSIYVADQGHNRIVRLDYIMQYTDDDYGFRYNQSYIVDASFRSLPINCSSPYSLAIHKGIQQVNQPDDSTNYVLWFSEGVPGNKKLTCVNAITGEFIQEIRSVRGVNINPSRISVYRSPDGQRNLLSFIDEQSNLLGILRLEPDGTFVNSDVNVRYLQDFGIIKLKSVVLSSYNNGIDGVTIWTVGDGGAGNCQGQTHCGDVSTLKVNYINNFPANVEYLATFWKGFGSPSSFVDIQNIYIQNSYVDIVTIEKWSDDFGLRRFKPGVNVVSSQISDYCYPAEYCTYTVKLTNPARVKFRGQYKPANGQWSDQPITVNNSSADPIILLPSGTNQLTIKRGSSQQNPTDPEQLKVIAEYIPSDESNFGNNNHKITLEKITNFINCSSVGGCPYLYVNNGIDYIQDNNILHRSEFDENVGIDIADKYVLRISPSFNSSDSTCSLKIKELNNDISHFDCFQLVAIDHPLGTSLGITESNNYVLYFPSATMSPSYAEHNEENVTNELNYDTNYTKIVRGVEDDEISGSYGSDINSLLFNKSKEYRNILIRQVKYTNTNNENNKKKEFQTLYDYGITDSIAVIFDPSVSDIPPGIIGPPNKRPAGNLVASEAGASEDPIVYDFAKRQNTSPVIVSVGQNINIDSVLTQWYSDFQISYLALSPVYYGGYNENSLTLVDAQDSINGNVLSSLLSIDTNYAVMDSLTHITLKFKNTFGSAPSGFVRSYALITNGRYERVMEGDNNIVNSYENQNLNLPREYKLFQNYPNPFNPRTTIKFEIPKPGQVLIKIYDILGKEVYSFNEPKHAGYYQLYFDGSNISSGIYFCKFVSGEYTAVKRMVLIK